MLTLEFLAALHRQFGDQPKVTVREFSIRDKVFAFNSRPSVMGVINLSPDSWYRESVCLTVDQAIRRGVVLAGQGADIIDVGAESTLAHAQRVSEGKQQARLEPVIQGLHRAGVLVSVETYQLSVALAALRAGASVLNVTGTQLAADFFKAAADHDAAVILCYVQGTNVREVGHFDLSGRPIDAMYEYFAHAAEEAARCGVRKLFLDPGLGFYYANLQDSAVRVRFQMEVFLQSFRLRALGFPICQALPHAFEYFGEEVRCAEPFFAVLAAIGKTDLFRTHEVPRVKAVLDTLSIFNPPPPPA